MGLIYRSRRINGIREIIQAARLGCKLRPFLSLLKTRAIITRQLCERIADISLFNLASSDLSGQIYHVARKYLQHGEIKFFFLILRATKISQLVHSLIFYMKGNPRFCVLSLTLNNVFDFNIRFVGKNWSTLPCKINVTNLCILMTLSD